MKRHLFSVLALFLCAVLSAETLKGFRNVPFNSNYDQVVKTATKNGWQPIQTDGETLPCKALSYKDVYYESQFWNVMFLFDAENKISQVILTIEPSKISSNTYTQSDYFSHLLLNLRDKYQLQITSYERYTVKEIAVNYFEYKFTNDFYAKNNKADFDVKFTDKVQIDGTEPVKTGWPCLIFVKGK